MAEVLGALGDAGRWGTLGHWVSVDTGGARDKGSIGHGVLGDTGNPLDMWAGKHWGYWWHWELGS